jgi:FtsP/CotA-like multicopper oxidase with cupredoxin domain
MQINLNRRDALKLGGLTVLGGVALAVPLGRGAQTKGSVSKLAAGDFPVPFTKFITKQPAAIPNMVGGVAHYDFTMKRNPEGQILPVLKTPVFGYDGVFPGPRIELDRGTSAVVRHRNELPGVGPFGSPAKSSVHLHGSATLPEFDGYANDVTAVGEYKDYQYPNHQPARTLWYHDHGVHWTAQQAYGGLAALYVMHDEDEQKLLPKGEFDIPLMINDASFEADGSLWYEDNSHSGLWGDVILVNGCPWPVMEVQRRTYRFRILDCSISRSYNWRLSNGMPLQVVATDGGLMPKGVAVTSMRHGGAERYEVVIDFSKVPTGTKRIELLNGSNANNVDYAFTGKVMAFDLLDTPVTKTRANYEDPSKQEPDPTWDRNYDGFPLVSCEIMDIDPNGSYKRRHFRVKRELDQWTIGEMTWHDVEDSDFTKVLANPEIGDVEIWEFENSSGGWFHPVHIHLIDFRIIARSGGVGKVLPHEEGPKDVMYVGEGETVSVLIKFTQPGGDPSVLGALYMVHCHNLPHEDHDMMSQFSVGKIESPDSHHPIEASRPCKPAAPAEPAIGTVTAGNASAVVHWKTPNDHASAITGFAVGVVNAANAQVGVLRPAAAAATSLNVSGLVNGQEYRFRVQASNALGTSEFSSLSSAVTLRAAPDAPKIGTVTAANTSALVRWTAPANGGSAITGYNVRVINAANAQVGALRLAAKGVSSLNVTGLSNGTKYRFLVQAKNAMGSSAFSGMSTAVTPSTTAGAPKIGTAFSGAAGGTITAQARWAPPTSNGGTAITGYVVTANRMSVTGKIVSRTTSAVQSASSRSLTMKLPAGKYRFVIRARNVRGLGATSATSRLVTAR